VTCASRHHANKETRGVVEAECTAITADHGIGRSGATAAFGELDGDLTSAGGGVGLTGVKRVEQITGYTVGVFTAAVGVELPAAAAGVTVVARCTVNPTAPEAAAAASALSAVTACAKSCCAALH